MVLEIVPGPSRSFLPNIRPKTPADAPNRLKADVARDLSVTGFTSSAIFSTCLDCMMDFGVRKAAPPCKTNKTESTSSHAMLKKEPSKKILSLNLRNVLLETAKLLMTYE
jgi:hypothetical protein